MSDFLSRLVERNRGGRDRIRPRLGSLFEPTLPAEMSETQSIMHDTLSSPPAALPTPETVPHQPVSTPVPQTIDPVTTVLQSGQTPEAALPQPLSPLLPTPESGKDSSPVISLLRHEHRRRTVSSEPSVEPSPSRLSSVAETGLVQDSASPGPQTPDAQQGESPKADVRQAAITIVPNPPAPTIKVEAPAQSFPDNEFIGFRRMAEQSPSLTVSPRQESADNALFESTSSQPPVTPQMQPLSPLPSPAPEPPTIQVTIGRIDVRAQISERHRSQPPHTRTRPQPALSLDDYLKQRGGSP